MIALAKSCFQEKALKIEIIPAIIAAIAMPITPPTASTEPQPASIPRIETLKAVKEVASHTAEAPRTPRLANPTAKEFKTSN